MTCTRPTPFEVLLALWTGDLPVEEAEALEEHIFGCDECARASDRLAKLIGGLVEVIPPVISRAHVTRLVDLGVRIHHNPVEADATARALFASDFDLLVHVLRGDLSRAERVDVEVLAQDGASIVSLEGVPFDARAGEVLLACQRRYQELYPSDLIFRVHAVERGTRHHVGDYIVHHEWE